MNSKQSSQSSNLSLLASLRRREGLLRILIFTLVTVLIWIGFEIYLSQQKTVVSEDFQPYTMPLNPNIDRAVLQEMQNLRSFTDEELQDFSLFQQLPAVSSPEETTPGGTASDEATPVLEEIPEPTAESEEVLSLPEETAISGQIEQ